MARSANYMINIGANVSNLVANTRVATRSLASMEYVAGRSAKKLGALSPLFESAGYLSGMSLMLGASSAMAARNWYEKVIYPAVQGAIELDAELRELYYLAGTKAGTSFADGIRERMQSQAIKSVLDMPSIVSGMSEIIKGGIRQQDATEMADSLTNLVEASFGKMKVQDAGKMIALLNLKFKRPDSQSVKGWSDYLTDMAVMGAQQTHLDIQDIFSMMGALSAAPQIATETSPQQFFAMLQMLAQAGKRARMSGMQLNSFVNDMLNATNTLAEGGAEKRIEAMGKLKLAYEDLFTIGPDGQKAIKSVPSFIATILGAREKMIAEKGADGHVFWSRQVDKMMGTNISTMMLQLAQSAEVITEQGIKLTGEAAIKEMERVYMASKGITEKAARAYRESWRGQIEIVSGIWKTFFALLGEDMLKQLAAVMTMTKGVMQNIVEFASKYPVFVRLISSLVLGMFALNVAVTAVAAALAGVSMFTIFLFPGFVQMAMALKSSAASAASFAKKLKEGHGISKQHLEVRIKAKKEELELLRVRRAYVRAQTMSKTLSQAELKIEMQKKAALLVQANAKIASVGAELAGLTGKLATAGAAIGSGAMIAGAVVLTGVLLMAAVAAGLLFTGFLALGRVMYKGGKDGLVGAFDSLVAKGKAALDMFMALYSYMTTGKWDEAMNDRLQASGGAAWLDRAVKIWERLKAVWEGIVGEVDWNKFDNALASLSRNLGFLFGGPMDTKVTDSRESWVKLGKSIGVLVTNTLTLSAMFMRMAMGVVLLFLAIAMGVGWVAQKLGLVSDETSTIQTGLYVLAGSVFAVTAAMLLLATAAALALGVIGVLSLAMIGFSLLTLAVVFAIPIAFAYAAYQIYENWETVTNFMKDAMLSAYDYIVGLINDIANNPFLKAGFEVISKSYGFLKQTFVDPFAKAAANTTFGPTPKNTVDWGATSKGVYGAIGPQLPGYGGRGGLTEQQRREMNAVQTGSYWGASMPPPPVAGGTPAAPTNNQTLNVTANINVPPGTPPDSVGKELGRELARQVYNVQDYRGARPSFD